MKIVVTNSQKKHEPVHFCFWKIGFLTDSAPLENQLFITLHYTLHSVSDPSCQEQKKTATLQEIRFSPCSWAEAAKSAEYTCKLVNIKASHNKGMT